MVIGSLYNQLLLTLEQNPTLKLYVKTVFEGIRFDIAKESYPCLMVEVVRNNEIEKDFGQVKRVWAEFDIFGHIFEHDQDSQIVGDKRKGVFGILNIENDIRACLQSSNTLGDRAIDLQMYPTEFEYKFYPVRGLRIRARVLYQQTDSL